MVIFNLLTFPDVCRLCLQSKHPDELVSVSLKRPLLEGTLNEKLEELTFKLSEQAAQFVPSQVCSMCLEVFDFFYKYKQKLKFIHRFMEAFIEVKLGNEQPLVDLLNNHNEYFSILFKDLDLMNKDHLRVEDMLAEYPQYLIALMSSPVKTENSTVMNKPNEDDKMEYLEEEKALDEVAFNSQDNLTVEQDDYQEEICEVKQEHLPSSHIEIKTDSIQDFLSGHECEEPQWVQSEYSDDCEEDFLEEAIDEASKDNAALPEVEKESLPSGGLREIIHNICYSCKRCRFKTNLKQAFDAHQKRHEENDHLEGVHCVHPSCLRVFPTQDEYEKHLEEGIHKLHICDICGASLKHKYSLEVHLARHAGEPQFHCNYCSAAFYSKTERRNHMNSIHMSGDQCKCVKCGATFKNKKLLNQHMESHVEERNFKCTACDFAFKTQQHLKRHISTVHREVRFACDYCDASYGRKDKLRMHIERAHNIQSYFICDVCLRSFNNASSLAEHKNHHENPKQLECAVCLIAYQDQDTFDKHLCISYRDDYICCEKDFKFHVHFNRHMMVKHGVAVNARVKPKLGILMGQLRARRRQTLRCQRCKQIFYSVVDRRRHLAICNNVGSKITRIQSPLAAEEMGEEEHLEDELQIDTAALGDFPEYVINEEV